MKLYHVQAEDPQGENLDWFVVAEDPDQAQTLWANVVEENGLDCANGVTRIRVVLEDVAGTRFDRPARGLNWDEFPIVFER